MNYTAIEQAINESLVLFKDGMKEQLSAKNVNASGKLDSSVEVVMVTSPSLVSGTVRALSYWFYSNYGRGGATRATMPKGAVRANIRKWIDDKGINPRPGPGGKTVTKDELAFLITRKIQREGYEGKMYIDEVIERVQPEVDKLIENAVYNDLQAWL